MTTTTVAFDMAPSRLRDAHILLSLAVTTQRTFGRPPNPEMLVRRLPANRLNYHIFSLSAIISVIFPPKVRDCH